MIMLWVGVSWRGWDRMDVTSEKYTNIMRASELLLSQHEEEISIPSFPEGIKVFLDTFHVGDYAFSSRHWHRSIQFNVILEGTLDVSVNGKDSLLQRGDGIFINSNVFHHLNFKGESECVGYSFQLHPSAICSEKDIYLYTKYVASVINNADLNYLTFKEEVPWHSGVLNYLNRAFISANQQDFAYELDVKNLLSCAWMLMLRNYNSIPANNTDSYTLSNAPRIKEMLSYIQNHYSDRITLSQIAASASISLSECNRCFKRFLKLTPIEYLTQVRVAAACRLLKEGTETIASVAEDLGFADYSYFHRVFKKYMGCTPKEYMEMHHA